MLFIKRAGQLQTTGAGTEYENAQGNFCYPVQVEGQAAELYPEFGFREEHSWMKINYEEGTITIGGKIYQLLDDYFPT